MTTSLYAALLCAMYIALSVYTVRGRMRFKIGIGDSGHEGIRRRIRAHANFAEYAPLYLMMLWIAESGGLPSSVVHVLGLIFIFGRVLHAYSLLVEEGYDEERIVKGGYKRIAGMVCTFGTLAILACLLMAQYFYK